MSQAFYLNRNQTKKRRFQTKAAPRHGLTATTNVLSSPWYPILDCGNSGSLNLKIWSTGKSIVNDYDANSSDYTQYQTGRILLPRKQMHPRNEGNPQLLRKAPKPMLQWMTCPSDQTTYPLNHLPSFYKIPIVSLNLYLQAPMLAESSVQKSSTSIVPKMSALPNL